MANIPSHWDSLHEHVHPCILPSTPLRRSFHLLRGGIAPALVVGTPVVISSTVRWSHNFRCRALYTDCVERSESCGKAPLFAKAPLQYGSRFLVALLLARFGAPAWLVFELGYVHGTDCTVLCCPFFVAMFYPPILLFTLSRRTDSPSWEEPYSTANANRFNSNPPAE